MEKSHNRDMVTASLQIQASIIVLVITSTYLDIFTIIKVARDLKQNSLKL